MGFSPIGLAISVAVLTPNLLMLIFPPRDAQPVVRVPGPVSWLERAGQALCRVVPAITAPAAIVWPWLANARRRRLRWRYLAGGAGERTALLPAGGTRLPDMYLLLIEALERDFRVIAPAYPAGAGIAGLADGLAAILDAEGVHQADVLGSFFGGFVAQEFARRHPERVRRLVLANTGSPATTPLPLLPLLIRLLAVFPEKAVRWLTGWKWRRWFVPEWQSDAVFWKSLLSDVLGQLGKEDLLSGLREMNEFAHLPAGGPRVRTQTMPAPVLLIE